MVNKARRAGRDRLVAPAHDQGLEQGLNLAPGIQKGAALRRAQPLVQVARVEIDAQRFQVQRELTRRMRAVDEGQDARRAGAPAKRHDRQDDSRGRGEVAEIDHPRARGHLVPNRFDDLGRIGERIRKRRGPIREATLAGQKAPGPVAGAVLVIGGQHLIAGPKIKAARDDVDPGRGVDDIHQIVGIAAKISGQRLASRMHQFLIAPAEEEHRLALELALPVLVALKHGDGRGAKRAMIEKGDGRVDQEMRGEGAAGIHGR